MCKFDSSRGRTNIYSDFKVILFINLSLNVRHQVLIKKFQLVAAWFNHPALLHDFTIYAEFKEDFIDGKTPNITNTVNSNQYSFFFLMKNWQINCESQLMTDSSLCLPGKWNHLRCIRKSGITDGTSSLVMSSPRMDGNRLSVLCFSGNPLKAQC